MSITHLDHVQLAMPAGEEPEARAFFGDLLGLQEIAKPEALQGRGGVWFAISSDRQLHLGVEEGFSPSKKAHPCFVSDDLDRLAEAIQQSDYPVKWDDGLAPVRRFYSEDCFGNRLEFVDRCTFIADRDSV
ncbi:MAG: glyoxalase [Planctomycetota bacterium]